MHDWTHSGTSQAHEALDVQVLQAIASGSPRAQWQASPRGLGPLDTAMNVAVPELDGRIITVPISFKEMATSSPSSKTGKRPGMFQSLTVFGASPVGREDRGTGTLTERPETGRSHPDECSW